HKEKEKEREKDKETASLAASLNSRLQLKPSNASNLAASPPKNHDSGHSQSPSTSSTSSIPASGHSPSASGHQGSTNSNSSTATLTTATPTTATNGSGSHSNGASASGTPTPTSGSRPREGGFVKSGLLTIRVVDARGLALPPGLTNPPYVPKETQQPSNRESVQRKWWLPYAVLEFDKNEVLIDALGGELSNPVWHYRAHFDVSRESDVQLSLYIRIPNPKLLASLEKSGNMRECETSSEDVFLGHVQLQPRWQEQMQDDWFNLQGGAGKIRVQLAFKKDNTNTTLTVDAFDLLKVIGKGSFGKVMQVRKRDTSRIYAMKIIRKAHIISRSEVNHTLAERTVLAQINNPFIVPLKFSFQSPEKLYLVLAFVNGGELFHHLQREGRFSEERSRFYAAELLCALECLHGFNVVYRDLKPENILLDYNGHIALCDFGLCKLGMTETETTNTFCGTPEYLAPELLLGNGYTKTVDWWTLGVLLYEMLTGLPPFYDENIHDMYRKILHDELRFPEDVAPDARALLSELLTRDPNQRLGNNGSGVIKSHPFFRPISFPLLMEKKIQPPFKPSVSSAIDTSNFDEEFTSEEPLDSVVESSYLSETVQLQFKGFTYNPANDGVLGASIANHPSAFGNSGGERRGGAMGQGRVGY
ncbi:AGC protein kinase Gad8, partial [Lunasporangiospora selenospora]